MLSDPIHRGILTFFNPESIIKYGIPGVMRTCFIMIGYFLKREGIADNILCQGFPSILIISCHSRLIVCTKAGMLPVHKFVDYVINRACNKSYSLCKTKSGT